MNLKSLVRPNIWNLIPYSSARHEFGGIADILLDANENPYGGDYSRYPDPLQIELKKLIAREKGIQTNQIFLGNGSDEAIDLLIRIFCEPGLDEIMVLPPTYGMYQVCADVSNVAVKKSLLTDDFQLQLADIRSRISTKLKLLFICSPNN
ncbi:MAG: aminotransferase class I/II-fold pyridoxal phosphate-dependent enzyme, partial [Saprospiraceae bacterium]|nr:aminotransferase class I/II-fold pyridoxal phosphate-dependent enzyme [Saprospiraceae bacterium]